MSPPCVSLSPAGRKAPWWGPAPREQVPARAPEHGGGTGPGAGVPCTSHLGQHILSRAPCPPAPPPGATGGCDTPRCPLQGSNVLSYSSACPPRRSTEHRPAAWVGGARGEPGVLMLAFLQVVPCAPLETANHSAARVQHPRRGPAGLSPHPVLTLAQRQEAPR